FACPSDGSVPVFSPLLHQAVYEDCFYYTTAESSNLAASWCTDVGDNGAVRDGPIDSELTTSTFTGAPRIDFYNPRLTPEGDELWVRRTNQSVLTYSVYVPSAGHGWTFVRDLSVTVVSNDGFSAPTRKVGGARRFVHLDFSAMKLHEYRDDGATATLVHTYA